MQSIVMTFVFYFNVTTQNIIAQDKVYKYKLHSIKI